MKQLRAEPVRRVLAGPQRLLSIKPEGLIIIPTQPLEHGGYLTLPAFIRLLRQAAGLALEPGVIKRL